MTDRRTLLSLAVLAVAVPSANAYEIWIDLNTYVKDRQGTAAAVGRTNAFAGADGVWLITDNSYGNRNVSGVWSGIDSGAGTGFTLTDWRTMVANIAGANARLATEDNPYYDYPGHGPHFDYQSYNDAKTIIGTGGATGFSFTDAFEYNETGSTAGGTVLSTDPGTGRTVPSTGITYDTQVQTYAATHGGKIGYLTRGYTTGWTGPVEAAAADTQVSAGVMETVSLEGQNTAGWINSVTQPLYNGSTLVRPAKPAYVLLTTATYRNLPGLYYLKQFAPDAVAGGLVRFVLNNDYSTTNTAGDGTDGYGFYGANTTAGADARDTVEGQQDLLTALKTATPVESWQWKTAGTANWSSRGNWSVTPNTGTEATFRAGQAGPLYKWDAAAFTSPSLTGSVTVNVDVSTAKALAMYFDGSASYTINGTNAITLASYGTVGADGRAPTVSGSIPTGPSTNATAYAANIIPIQMKGTGGNTINAPITLDATDAAGLMIDNQTAPATGYNLFLSGKLTTSGLPIYVIGTGNSAIFGQIVGPSAIEMDGANAFAFGGSTSNVGVTLTANSGRTYLYATGTAYAADAVLDIAAGAVVRPNPVTPNANQLNPAYNGANVTINSGGTLDLYGKSLNLTALAGTNGTVTDTGGTSGPVAATLTVGVNNQSAAFAGTIANGLFNGTTAAVLSLTKTGSGTQTLSGNNAFTGGATINAGTLAAAANAALGVGGVAINGVGSSAAAAAGTLALSGNVTVANAVTLQGPRSDPASAAGVPPQILNLSGNNTLASNLTLTSAGGLGVLVRSDGGTLTLGGTLKNDNSPGYARPYILYGAGNGIVSGTIANGVGATAVTKQGAGTWSVTGSASYSGASTVQGGTLRLGKNAFAPVLTNAGGADVQTGKLVFDYSGGGTDPVATVKSLLTSGYAAGFTTASNRLRSTTATAARGLGYADSGTAVTVAATLYGDADLDFDVDFNDFLALQNSYGQSGTTFAQGDFNYDGKTDFNDFLALQNNYGQSVASSDTAAAVPVTVTASEWAALAAFAASATVPEPASIGLLATAALVGLRRRR